MPKGKTGSALALAAGLLKDLIDALNGKDGNLWFENFMKFMKKERAWGPTKFGLHDWLREVHAGQVGMTVPSRPAVAIHGYATSVIGLERELSGNMVPTEAEREFTCFEMQRYMSIEDMARSLLGLKGGNVEDVKLHMRASRKCFHVLQALYIIDRHMSGDMNMTGKIGKDNYLFVHDVAGNVGVIAFSPKYPTHLKMYGFGTFFRLRSGGHVFCPVG
jgi:hypothetical protein